MWMSASRSLTERKLDQGFLADSDSEYEHDASVEETATESFTKTCEFENVCARENPGSAVLLDSDLQYGTFELSKCWDQIDQYITLTSSESETESDCSESLKDGLVKWANEFQIKHNALDNLLLLLQKSGHPDLPSSARTLLKTTREVHTQLMSGMEYIYLGLEKGLLRYVKDYAKLQKEPITALEISLNIDGLPLFKSSGKGLWPVLCAVVNMQPVNVFPIALTFGNSKPSNLDFLKETVEELKNLMENGLSDGEKTISVLLKCITCDAPAKAMVKKVKMYSRYSGCDRCTQRGVWIGRMTYQDITNIVARTDTSFRGQSDEEHHLGLSPFCYLPIDIVKTFPIDYMHQVCLGCTKRLILTWMRGAREVKLSAGQIQEISDKLVKLNQTFPTYSLASHIV